MALLVLGLLLWSMSHLFKRLAPTYRAEMGDKARGMVAIASFAGIALMVLGYRSWDSGILYAASASARHLNNLLMLVSMYLFAAAGMKTWIARQLRHPQLLAVILWAVAHLLVNGDWASVVLFGGLLIWALVSILMINSQEPGWAPPPAGPASKELAAIVGAVVVTGGIGYIHILLGYVPFG